MKFFASIVSIFYLTSLASASVDLPRRPSQPTEPIEKTQTANKEKWDQEATYCDGSIEFDLPRARTVGDNYSRKHSVDINFEMVGKTGSIMVTPEGIATQLSEDQKAEALLIEYRQAAMEGPKDENTSLLSVSLAVGSFLGDGLMTMSMTFDPLLITSHGETVLEDNNRELIFAKYYLVCGPESYLQAAL